MIVQRLLNQLIAQNVRDFRVLAAIAKVPRQLFVDEAMAHKAWDNTALPIGHGQTISQPYIVARMTEQLLMGSPNSVLEIGTGSGYQTAVLAQLVNHVYTVERIKTLQYQPSDAYSGWICTTFPPGTVMVGLGGQRKLLLTPLS